MRAIPRQGLSFPSASWMLDVGISVTTKRMMNPNAVAELRDGSITLKKTPYPPEHRAHPRHKPSYICMGDIVS